MRFYTIDFDYLKHLKAYDDKVPNFDYEEHDKFFFGVVITVNEKNYYVPVSSKKYKNSTSMPIKEYGKAPGTPAKVLGTLRFAYMIPVADAELTELDIDWLRRTTMPSYADLVAKEYEFCKTNFSRIQRRASVVYNFGTDPTSPYYDVCCKFKELEVGFDEWQKSIETAENTSEIDENGSASS